MVGSVVPTGPGHIQAGDGNRWGLASSLLGAHNDIHDLGTTPQEDMGGQASFDGVNIYIGSSAGTINHGLFVWSGGSVLLGISEKWIGAKSQNGHLTAQHHQKAVDANDLNLSNAVAVETRNSDTVAALAMHYATLPSLDLLTPHPLENNQGNEDVYHKLLSTLTDDASVEFSAGTYDVPNVGLLKLQQQLTEFGLWDEELLARELGFGVTEKPPKLIRSDEDETLTNVMQEMNVNGEFSAEKLLGMDDNTSSADVEDPEPTSKWFPYPTKMMFILDTIDNLPCLRISDSLMKIILWGMKECGASNVLSFSLLRKSQEKLRKHTSVATKMYKSILGNIFWMNSPVDIIAKDFSNPLVRPHLHLYPEEPPDGKITKVWHCEKWHKGIPPEYLTPMYDAGSKHFYVDEFCRTQDSDLVVPKRWDKLVIIDSHVEKIQASDLIDNLPDLVNLALNLSCEQEQHMQGDPLYTILIDKWHNDVSGNISKSYNLHYNTYIAVRNPPRKLLQQEFNVHFVCSSPNAEPSEQAAAVKEANKATHLNPVQTYDAMTRSTCRFQVLHHTGPSDNPMQSEECVHIGAKARESAITLDEQLRLASLGVATRWAQELRNEFPNKTREEISNRLMMWVGERKGELLNPSISTPALPLLDPGYDPHLDTPIELLHTILLGIIKYVWYSTHSTWKDNQKLLFSLRLQATNISVRPDQGSWGTDCTSLGGSIGDIKQYGLKFSLSLQEDLDICVANILDLFVLNVSSKITTKIKFHLLAHARAHVIRFGPLIGSSTEIMECFNSIFRACSILSNHQAPSRDIAIQLAGLESAKQWLTGGWWQHGNGTWVRASGQVQAYLLSHLIIKNHLGWADHHPITPGMSTLFRFYLHSSL
ncbi:uncharacterized protein LACBIDRAFT_334078 [Laccaria bicolor S238N-H82]|uniref:Predicted protein n=1 Tax=Laccaria bicolor (strain S238N-H82 / ATCC MYA-4686) TaxID=486041 RepID=B0DY07_LACBS|nr:uncharacterized protein LACBIDRAFT_334078 [Laccaria bicolor S238N-H82]EDR00603.1 predicted protein [Laccaria bicolor S238N-H82]|eukprot:XP_001888830.1 predicted protein [Laccaria bicolor S238N-H82]